MMVLGGPVQGGKVYGKWPGLEKEQLFEGRDLAVTTDFRAVLSELISGHLGQKNLTRCSPDSSRVIRSVCCGHERFTGGVIEVRFKNRHPGYRRSCVFDCLCTSWRRTGSRKSCRSRREAGAGCHCSLGERQPPYNGRKRRQIKTEHTPFPDCMPASTKQLSSLADRH